MLIQQSRLVPSNAVGVWETPDWKLGGSVTRYNALPRYTAENTPSTQALICITVEMKTSRDRNPGSCSSD